MTMSKGYLLQKGRQATRWGVEGEAKWEQHTQWREKRWQQKTRGGVEGVPVPEKGGEAQQGARRVVVQGENGANGGGCMWEGEGKQYLGCLLDDSTQSAFWCTITNIQQI